MGIQNFLKEISDTKRFKNLPSSSREIVFYSESPIYYNYYEDIISYILETATAQICYITSELYDPVFQKQNDRFKVFYIKNLVAPLIRELDAKVLIMTMPDLERFHIKRSIYKVNHLYLYHAIVSTHMVYRKGAFDHYDTLLCVGSHHIEEIRKTEEIYNLPPKTLIEAGYPRLERIYKDHQTYDSGDTKPRHDRNYILIAPSWSDQNIIETYADELISHLMKLGDSYTIVLRPHPQFLRSKYKFVLDLKKKYKEYENIIIEIDLVSDTTIHSATVLITDWSGIAFEYAFGTERPVLFLDTPRKVYNPEYEKLGIEPLIVKLRNKIGKSVPIDELSTIDKVLLSLIYEKNEYRKKIIEYRNTYIFNWGKSVEVCGKTIINLCQ
ncbi:MAG: CDP-glycerol glycerophosphotransferase family protein [Spirochaetales bacterium]|nr:CDP-glycerol glycerophosphotransferase family protein [Spirochaetales bacterium]